MNDPERVNARDVAKEVAFFLGVNPGFRDEWVGKFYFENEAQSYECQVYSTVMHVNNDSLLLMNYHQIETANGKAFLIDYSGSDYNMRLVHLPDPADGKMIYMIAKTINSEVVFTTKVDILFVKDSI